MHSSHFLYSSPVWANLRGRQLGSRPPAAIPDHSLLPGLDDSARVMALWFGSSDQLRDDLHGVRIVYRDDHSAGARRGLSRKHQEDVSGTALVPGFVVAFARIVRLVFRALLLHASRGLRAKHVSISWNLRKGGHAHVCKCPWSERTGRVPIGYRRDVARVFAGSTGNQLQEASACYGSNGVSIPNSGDSNRIFPRF